MKLTYKIIAQYDKRTDAENLVGEPKPEGLDAIPSAKFKTNYAYFQIVMLAYNIWRYFKMMAQLSQRTKSEKPTSASTGLATAMNNTIRIARLKLLLIAGKVIFHDNRDQVRYSHDSRTPELMHFLNFLDKARSKVKPWGLQEVFGLVSLHSMLYRIGKKSLARRYYLENAK